MAGRRAPRFDRRDARIHRSAPRRPRGARAARRGSGAAPARGTPDPSRRLPRVRAARVPAHRPGDGGVRAGAALGRPRLARLRGRGAEGWDRRRARRAAPRARRALLAVDGPEHRGRPDGLEALRDAGAKLPDPPRPLGALDLAAAARAPAGDRSRRPARPTLPRIGSGRRPARRRLRAPPAPAGPRPRRAARGSRAHARRWGAPRSVHGRVPRLPGRRSGELEGRVLRGARRSAPAGVPGVQEDLRASVRRAGARRPGARAAVLVLLPVQRRRQQARGGLGAPERGGLAAVARRGAALGGGRARHAGARPGRARRRGPAGHGADRVLHARQGVRVRLRRAERLRAAGDLGGGARAVAAGAARRARDPAGHPRAGVRGSCGAGSEHAPDRVHRRGQQGP